MALFPDHSLLVSTKSHLSTFAFLIQSGNAAKHVNALWADADIVSLGGASVIKACIKQTCGWQPDSSLVPEKTRTCPATPTLPALTWFTHTHKNCLQKFQKTVCQIQPGSSQSEQKEYYSVDINFSFTHTFYLYLPTLLLCLCLPPFTAHLLSFTSPLCVSRFPALWHELSVLPVIPIIEPCSGAENRGLESQMCGAPLFCTLHQVTWSTGLFVKSWFFAGDWLHLEADV